MLLSKEKLKTYINWLVLLLSFSIPFIGFNIPKYVLGVSIILKIIDIISDFSGYKFYIKKNKTLVLISGSLFFFYLLTLIYSIDYNRGIELVLRNIYIIVFPILFLNLKNGDKIASYENVLKAFLYGVIGVMSLTFVLWLFKNAGEVIISSAEFKEIVYSLSYERLANLVKLHPGYFSLMIFTGYSINYYYLENKTKVIIGIVMILFLFLLATRIIILLSVFITFYFLISLLRSKDYRFSKQKMIFLGSIVLLFAWGLSSFDFEDVYRVSNFQNAKELISKEFNSGLEISTKGITNDLIARVYQVKCSMQVIFRDTVSTLFGYGLGDFEYELIESYKRNNFEWGIQEKFNSHNQYLSMMLIGGIFGLISLLLYLLTPIFVSVGRKKRFYFSILSVFIVYAVTESYLLRENGIIILTFFIASTNLISTQNQNNH